MFPPPPFVRCHTWTSTGGRFFGGFIRRAIQSDLRLNTRPLGLANETAGAKSGFTVSHDEHAARSLCEAATREPEGPRRDIWHLAPQSTTNRVILPSGRNTWKQATTAQRPWYWTCKKKEPAASNHNLVVYSSHEHVSDGTLQKERLLRREEDGRYTPRERAWLVRRPPRAHEGGMTTAAQVVALSAH